MTGTEMDFGVLFQLDIEDFNLGSREANNWDEDHGYESVEQRGW